MYRRAVEVNNLIYSFSPEDSPAAGSRVWGLIRAQVRDELTGQPPSAPIALETDLLQASSRVADDGLVGLVGIPMQAFPALATQNYKVTMNVQAEGYVAQDVVFTIAQSVSFPGDFTPPPAAEISLHHEPIVISGQVMLQAANGTKTPISGATVHITGIWRMAPPANMVFPPDLPNIVSLGSVLYSDRTSGITNLIQQDLTQALGDDKMLLDDCLAGTQKIRLSNWLNLVPPPTGTLLLIDADQPDISEYLAVNLIKGVGTPDQQANITLDYPLANNHRRNAIVRRVTPQSPGTPIPLLYDAIAGDTCIFLKNLTGLAMGNQVRISDGALPDEFHRVSLFSASSDADGYFRLPLLARVAQLILSAEQGALTPVTTELRPDYSLRENRLDLVMR